MTIRRHRSFSAPLTTGFTMKRPGLSLLEVLVSVFILTIGMLSVVALIPVATHNMLETTKMDRGAATARAAMHELRSMGLMDRQLWCDAALNANTSPIADRDYSVFEYDQSTATWKTVLKRFAIRPTVANSPGDADPLLGQAFMIDPLGIARYHYDMAETGGTPTFDIGRFPFVPGLAGSSNPGNAGDDQIHIPRLSIAALPLNYLPTNIAQIRHDFYQRLFVSADDAVFDVPEERDQRPSRLFGFSDGTVSHKLFDPTITGYPLRGQINGDYSWLMTVVPMESDTPFKTKHAANEFCANQLYLDHQKRYRVSIVVFFKRNFDFDGAVVTADEPRAERRVLVQLVGNDVRDVRLLVPVADGPQALALKKNEWLMLFGVKGDPRLDYNAFANEAYPGSNSGSPQYFPGYRKIAQWYRVVSLDGEPTKETLNGSDYWTRYVTLAGPDWNSATGVIPDPVFQADPLDLKFPAGPFFPLSNIIPAGLTTIDGCAFLVDNVIAVKTTDVEIE